MNRYIAAHSREKIPFKLKAYQLCLYLFILDAVNHLYEVFNYKSHI